MLAFSWPWLTEDTARFQDMEQRLAASLCAGIGGHAAAVTINGTQFAYRPLPVSAAAARVWRPAILPDGRIAAFHGYFDNAGQIAAELGVGAVDPAMLYGLAVAEWGDAADRKVIGEYCTVIADPARRIVRLARSPLRAPPLHYWHGTAHVAAASVPRALFATGAEERLNREHMIDSALINFTDQEATWFEGVLRVPAGTIVELAPGKQRVRRDYYDLCAAPDITLPTDADYVARTQALLTEGVKACLDGASRPGATLSSGLDSPQVVASALAVLPESQRLPTFTFFPEAGWDGVCESTVNGNERPMVEAFAAMHPRIEPHFTDNAGYGHDHRWEDMFHLMGGAPSGLCNMYLFHGLFAAARRVGCDRLLLAEFGNYTFSDRGDWAFVEYLCKGQWRQLLKALTGNRDDPRPLWRRFLVLCLVPLLPDRIWRKLIRLWHPGERVATDLLSPLDPEFRETSGADRRVAASGLMIDRYHPHDRRHAMRLLFQNGDAEAAEIYQAFEQLYGIPLRDPTAYRPLVEFCVGLPVHLFHRDGVVRWLAKEMARGIMPEDQRQNRLNGRWDADWHLRIGRQRSEYLAELDRIAADPVLAPMIDHRRLRTLLEDWPKGTITDRQRVLPLELALPRAALTARFLRYVGGRNNPAAEGCGAGPPG